MLHRAPVEVDLDEGGRDHRHGKRRERDPRGQRHDRAEHDPPAGARKAAGLLLRERRRIHHAALLATIACACCCIAFITCAAGPYWATRPAARTRILSTCAISDGRWVTTIAVTPSLRTAPSACASAASPSPSRLEFGSSSTRRRGSPYRARARAMRWRCPGERRPPCAPTGVS